MERASWGDVSLPPADGPAGLLGWAKAEESPAPAGVAAAPIPMPPAVAICTSGNPLESLLPLSCGLITSSGEARREAAADLVQG